MTSKEIKENVTMTEVLSRYGISVRNHMCSCPFHGKDRHPSMKIYKDGYHCFTCGAHGDVFGFVMRMDSCDFKTAFLSLGGEYERMPEQERQARREELARQKQAREAEKRKQEEERMAKNRKITHYREVLDTADPFSDEWFEAVNALPVLLGEVEADAGRDS